MLHRAKGVIVFECDGCADTIDTETSDFGEARAKMKSEDWKATTEDDGKTWEHWCSGCGKK